MTWTTGRKKGVMRFKNLRWSKPSGLFVLSLRCAGGISPGLKSRVEKPAQRLVFGLMPGAISAVHPHEKTYFKKAYYF